VCPSLIINTDSCVEYKHHYHFKGFGNISGNHYWGIINSAKKRNLEVTIDGEELWSLFLKQKGHCALTGMQLWFPKKNTDPRTVSLDRINNKLGYVSHNLQWVHSDINTKLKKHLSEKALLTIAKVITRNSK